MWTNRNGGLAADRTPWAERGQKALFVAAVFGNVPRTNRLALGTVCA
jgi:hypothetical protein